LLEIVKKIMAGTNEGSYLEGIDTIVFSEHGIHSYNDNISISVNKETGLVGAVNAKDFHKLLEKLKTEEIEVETLENQWKIKSGNTDITLNLKEDHISEYIQELEVEDKAFSKLPENFIEGLKLCKIPGNASYLRGVYVSGTNMICTDEVRLSFFKLKESMATFWVDDSCIVELLKLAETITEYCVMESWIHFKGETGTVFSAKRNQDDQYPVDTFIEYQQHYVKTDKDVSNQLPKQLAEVIDRVGVLYSDIDGFQIIDFELKKDKIVLSSKNANGKIKENVKFEKPFSEDISVKFKLDHTFMKEALVKCPFFFIRQEEDSVDVVFTNDDFTQILKTVSD